MAEYGYIRRSKDTISADNQRLEILNHEGIDTERVIWIEEIQSGAKAHEDRALGKLIAKLNPKDVVYVADLTRLSRGGVTESFVIAAKILAKGARLIFTRISWEFKPDDETSETIFFAFSIAAKYERKWISQRTKIGLQVAKANGQTLGRPKGSVKKIDRAELEKFIKAGYYKYTDLAWHVKVDVLTIKKYLTLNPDVEILRGGVKLKRQ